MLASEPSLLSLESFLRSSLHLDRGRLIGKVGFLRRPPFGLWIRLCYLLFGVFILSQKPPSRDPAFRIPADPKEYSQLEQRPKPPQKQVFFDFVAHQSSFSLGWRAISCVRKGAKRAEAKQHICRHRASVSEWPRCRGTAGIVFVCLFPSSLLLFLRIT